MKAPKARKTADGITVYCGHNRMMHPDELKPHPKAFRDHSRAQRAILGEIIEKSGWREPVTVSKRSGFVTRGYARVLAAKDRGWKDVPVDEQAYKNEAAELADAIADTKIQEFSKLDSDKLRAIIGRLQEKDFDLRLTGLEQSVIDGILADYERNLQMNIEPGQGGDGEHGIRQVILVYDDQRFNDFTEAVRKIEGKRKFESLSELCLTLLRERNETNNARTKTNRSTAVRKARSTGK